jgi:UDP-2,3-diacylglucosamine pyrophosphatase LpxH
MTINLPDTIKDLYIVGDVHGEWNSVIHNIRQYKIKNSVFIFCGDVGIGFERLKHYTDHVIPELHKVLKKFNDIFIWIRGNHSNPKYYNNQLINTNYVKCVPDYTIINTCNLNILCIGGATSVDRIIRKQNDSINIVRYMKYHNCDCKTAELNAPKTYWEDEIVQYRPKVDAKIDIICSHTAPSFCFPTDKGSIVQEYSQYDNELLKDIEEERAVMDMVYNDYKDDITNWYYGHFHQSNTQIVDNICFRLLNIGETCRYYDPSSSNNIL